MLSGKRSAEAHSKSSETSKTELFGAKDSYSTEQLRKIHMQKRKDWQEKNIPAKLCIYRNLSGGNIIKNQSSFINQWVQIHDNDAGARYIGLALDFKQVLTSYPLSARKHTCLKIRSCFNRPYRFNFFKGCLPQILLGPFWMLWML